jgi:hypothetical protein
MAALVVLFRSALAAFLRHAAGAVLIQLLQMPPTPPPAFVRDAAGAILNWPASADAAGSADGCDSAVVGPSASHCPPVMLNPGCHRTPNPSGERTFEEEVERCFQISEAERTEISVGQLSAL